MDIVPIIIPTDAARVHCRSLRAEKSELVEQKLARITEMEKTSLSVRISQLIAAVWCFFFLFGGSLLTAKLNGRCHMVCRIEDLVAAAYVPKILNICPL